MFCLTDRRYSENSGDMMETVENPSAKCGQSFPDSCISVSHSCAKSHATPPTKRQLCYKCSQCDEGFSKTAALKHHFKTNHGDYRLQALLQGPFTCSEQDCQFISADHLEYQAHLESTHGRILIPCTYRSCRASFLAQGEMDNHRKSHMPFGCFHCEFVSENAKELNTHLLEHNNLTSNCRGETSKAACTDGGKLNRVSLRGKRNLKSIPVFESSSLEDEPEEEQEREEDRKDNSSAEDAVLLPSKEYLAEGSEHIYRTHTCPKCRRCFKMRSHLQEHLRLHFPDPSLQCPTCQRFFTSKSKLRIHRLREAGEKSHRCHLCEYAAVERNAICRHLVSVHAGQAEDAVKSLRYVCPACGEAFHQSRKLKTHMKTHNAPADREPLPCFHESCSFQTRMRKDLIRHAAEAHGVAAVECRHHACGAVFPNEADMETHYRTHLAYHCSECDFSCSNKTLFLQHRRHGHSGKDKLSCDFCAFVTFNPVEFEQHVGHLHANEKTHRCSQCSYVTSHKRGLKRHLLMHSGEKPHKCSRCDFRCRDESYLSRHMLTHSEDKNFMCAECGYVTKWKHYLNVHMRKHAGDLRYSCDQCPYRCHRMDQLNSHKLRHQAKSLMCEICAYACKRKYELRNHMLAKHSGEEKQPAVYKCKYCTYTTSYRQALQNHENCKHTKLKEFRCALCAYSSFSSISLFLHKRKVHGYVPGDKAWLENYAAKEKERNSSEFTQDFYIKPAADPDQSEQSTSAAAGNQTSQSNFAPQKVVNDVFLDPSVSSPEQYCTLVLTTVTSTNDQTPLLLDEERNSASVPSLNRRGPDSSQEKTDSYAPMSSSEDDNVAVHDRECEQSDIEDTCAPLNDTVEPLEGQTRTSEVEQSELRLKAMKKHDKDQAEAMVLEGRVQMLVVPTEDVYRCNKCSYVTSKETALKHHHRALCHGRVKGYKCPACGVQFKQKRGLDGHLKKKCPALRHKARAYLGTAGNSSASRDRSKEVGEGTSSDLSSQDKISEVCTPLTLTSTALDHQGRDTQIHRLVDKPSGDNSIQRPKTLYEEKDGKFTCKLCSFSSSKLQTVKQHLSTCRETSSRDQTMDHGRGNELLQATDQGETSKRTFGCPNCAFRCNQKRALDRHGTKGCMKPGEVQCSFCLFVAKSKLSLTRHVLYVHKKEKLCVGKPKRLRCQFCSFSCKQERCMDQHIALKHKGARPYRCRYCPFGTARRYRLEAHESLHTGVGRHRCDECDKTFGAVTKLRQHKMRTHDKRPKHFCSLCDFSGYTLDDVKRHGRRCHTGKLQHVCTHCNAKFSSEIALRNHCKRVHQLQVRFSCKKCDYTCSSDIALKAHHQSRHPQVKCTTCQESFETKESLEMHQRAHLAHQCQLCPFATKTRQLLAQHLLNQHEEGSPEDKPLKCSSCQFACRHQLVLEQHLRSHGSKRLYKCTDCEYSTRNKQKITWHVRTHTGEKPYSCEQCSYTCTDPSRLKLHMRVHQDEKKYLCPECGYKCKWATQLKYHMTKHTGEKPYACSDCEYRTNRADALRAHRDTQHSDLRPYVCEKCGKAFKTSFILKTHQRQHSDDRPYVCGLCHKPFRWPAGLRHHFLSHTKQQPFCCRHCSYRAKQKFQVVKHLRRHHPQMSVEQGVLKDAEAGGLTLKVALQRTLDELEDGSEKVTAARQNSDEMQ